MARSTLSVWIHSDREPSAAAAEHKYPQADATDLSRRFEQAPELAERTERKPAYAV